MGLEEHLFKVFVVRSEALGKVMAVKAKSRQEATNKIITFYRGILQEMEDSSPTGDVDLDLSFQELTEEVSEI